MATMRLSLIKLTKMSLHCNQELAKRNDSSKLIQSDGSARFRWVWSYTETVTDLKDCFVGLLIFGWIIENLYITEC